MLPKRLVLPASLAILTLAGACQPQEPAPNPDDPCLALGPDCASVLAADGGPVDAPDGGGRECLC
jgi:hypothetical protein